MNSFVKGFITCQHLRQAQAVASFVGRRALQTTPACQTKVALVLSGCGVYDGSEIHEASACMVHLSRHNAEVAIFAPDMNQLHVVNHVNGAPCATLVRNVFVESARIARGNIKPLNALDVEKFDAIVFPGGFGVAKNLCTYAVEGSKMTVNKDVEHVILAFHAAKKPIGLCCIAPLLAACAIKGCEVTIGSDFDTAKVIQELGSRHVNKRALESHIDTRNKIVTTPAFMLDAPIHEIFDGIGSMIAGVVKLAAGK
jgi:enhancing lycopene biosynthesis protein 2